MHTQCFIYKQINGLPLKEENNYKIEYHLKARSGRTVMTFDDENSARTEGNNRGLTCFRVTTITEKL